MKVVINACHGGFSLSLEAKQAYLAKKGMTQPVSEFFDRDLNRDDPVLVAVVEELGTSADTRMSELRVVEIPDDVEWQIEEYDGSEWVAEKHRTWC
jgi:hypothetical protein